MLIDCYETALLFSSTYRARVENTSVLQQNLGPTEIHEKTLIDNYGTGFTLLYQNGVLDMLATASTDNIKL